MEIQIKTLQPTKVNKVSRNIVNTIFHVKNVLSMPDRRIMIRLKDHEAGFNKKPLTKSIVTEILVFKDVQRINVRTDVPFRCLLKI